MKNTFSFKHKKRQGGSQNKSDMILLDHNGKPQMEMKGGEIVFSRPSTKEIINQAEKVSVAQMDEDALKELGRIVTKERIEQRKRDM